jgi:hypothetical protein
MPVYEVTDPSGRKLRLTGDAPPTKEVLDKIFASVPAATPAAPAKPYTVPFPTPQETSELLGDQTAQIRAAFEPEFARERAAQTTGAMMREMASRDLQRLSQGSLLDVANRMAGYDLSQSPNQAERAVAEVYRQVNLPNVATAVAAGPLLAEREVAAAGTPLVKRLLAALPAAGIRTYFATEGAKAAGEAAGERTAELPLPQAIKESLVPSALMPRLPGQPAAPSTDYGLLTRQLLAEIGGGAAALSPGVAPARVPKISQEEIMSRRSGRDLLESQYGAPVVPLGRLNLIPQRGPILMPETQFEVPRFPEKKVTAERPADPMLVNPPAIVRPGEAVPQPQAVITPATVATKPPVEPAGGKISFAAPAEAQAIPSARQAAAEPSVPFGTPPQELYSGAPIKLEDLKKVGEFLKKVPTLPAVSEEKQTLSANPTLVDKYLQGIRPAIKTVSRGIIEGGKGQQHSDVIAQNNIRPTDIDSRVFVGPDGVILSRQELANLPGIETKVEPGLAHSEDLIKAQRSYAKNVRINQGLPAQEGLRGEGSQTYRGGDIQQAAKPQEEPALPQAREAQIIDPNITSTKNVVMEQERQARNAPVLEQAATRDFPQAWQAAKKILDKNDSAGAALVAEINERPRALKDDVENALLLHEKIKVRNQYRQQAQELFDLVGKQNKTEADEGALVEAQNRMNVVASRLNEIDKATDRSGTAMGRGFNARKMMADEDYDLVGLELRTRVANGGNDLTMSERAKLKDKADAILKADKNYQDVLALRAKQGKKDMFAPEIEKARLQLILARRAADKDIAALERKQRPFSEKAINFWVKFHRANLISGLGTLAKLLAAASARPVYTLATETAGWGLSKVFPTLAKKATVEGGFHPAALAKSYAAMFTKGLADAAHIAKTGENPLDLLYGGKAGTGYGESDLEERSALTMFNDIHAMIKAPVKRQAFELALAKQKLNLDAAGVDTTDAFVQTRMAVNSMKEANRAIFLEDNIVVDAYNTAIRFGETRKGLARPSGLALSLGLRTVAPIVRVPSNVVAQAFESAVGNVTGGSYLIKAYSEGIKNLPEDKANLILRQMKNGSVGGTILITAFLLHKQIGGFYQQGVKKKQGDLPEGSIKIGDVIVPKKLMELPAFQVAQLGGSIGNWSEEKLRKGDAAAQGISEATLAAGLGLLSEAPLFREQMETAKAFNPYQRDKYFKNLAESLIVPRIVQEALPKEEPKPVRHKAYGGWK